MFQSRPRLGLSNKIEDFLFFVNMEPRFTDTIEYSLQSSMSSRRRQDNTVVIGKKSWSKLHPLGICFARDSSRGMLLSTEGVGRRAAGWPD